MAEKKSIKRPIKKKVEKVNESMPSRTEKVIEDLKMKYETSLEELEDLSIKAKKKVKKNPYESLAIASGVGAVVGMGIGAVMMHSAQGNKSSYLDYKHAFRNSGNDFRDMQSHLKRDIKQKPFQSIGVALGVGVLLGGLMKNMRCDEK